MIYLLLLTGVSALYLMNLAVLLRRVMRALPRITRLEAPAPARWPRVSMIMPTRDEARTLEPAMRSKLGNSYPELELVAAAKLVPRHTGRAVGAGPYCRDARVARRMADLPVFLRQSHAERDLEALAGLVVKQGAGAWSL
jgi:hypothetical protein